MIRLLGESTGKEMGHEMEAAFYKGSVGIAVSAFE